MAGFLPPEIVDYLRRNKNLEDDECRSVSDSEFESKEDLEVFRPGRDFFCEFEFEETSLKKSEQAATPEQRQAADAVNNVLEEIIQLPASKEICDARQVDVKMLTKVLENLKNSITQQTLIQLAAKCDHEQQERKGKLTRYMPDSVDAVYNVSESKKIRHAHDDDDEEETSLKKSEQVADNEGVA